MPRTGAAKCGSPAVVVKIVFVPDRFRGDDLTAAEDRAVVSGSRELPGKAPTPPLVRCRNRKTPRNRTVPPARPTRPGENRPQIRAPVGDGKAPPTADPPAKLDLAKDTRFTTDLPSRGMSSPIVWGNRIYLTGEDAGVMMLDRETGKLQWDTDAEGRRGGERAKRGGHGPARPAEAPGSRPDARHRRPIRIRLLRQRQPGLCRLGRQADLGPAIGFRRA